LGFNDDEKTSYKWSFFLKSKDELAETVFPTINQMIKQGKAVKYVRMDNAGENKVLAEKLKKWHPTIKIEYVPARTPQYNAIERHYPTLYGRVRAMLNAAKFDKEMRGYLWAEAAATATLVDNILTKRIGEPSAAEQFNGVLPKYARHLRTFGEIGVVKTSTKTTAKLDNKGETCLFLGYALNHPGDTYLLRNRNDDVSVTQAKTSA
jgi:hypothetical protein